jgi:ATP-dependent helicase/nuclease subunit A
LVKFEFAPAASAYPERRELLQVQPKSPIELGEASDLELKRDRAEAIRVAYVAATRARELLVVPVCGDQPIEGWFEVLDPILYPPDGSRRTSEPAPGCPTFGEDSVLERGPKGKVPVTGSVRPGVHMSVPDGAPVVWWDPAALALEVEELATLRHQRILEVDPDGAAAAASEQNYAAWKAEREALLSRAANRRYLCRPLLRSFVGRRPRRPALRSRDMA